MNSAELQQVREEYNAWSVENEHNIMCSYPRSGRNYVSSLLRRLTGRVIQAGIAPPDGMTFSDVFLNVAHLKKWDISGDKGRYVFLVRDPRDCILSAQYHRASRTDENVQELMANRGLIRHSAWQWTEYIDVLMPYKPHIVQYEKLMLRPVETVAGLLEHLSIEPIDDIARIVKEYDITKPDPIDPRTVESMTFNDGLERYRDHCLKWQRDQLMDEESLNIIWDQAGDKMLSFGYTPSGHSADITGRKSEVPLINKLADLQDFNLVP